MIRNDYVMGRCPHCNVWIACQSQDDTFIGDCPCGTTFEVDWTGMVVHAD